MTKTFIVPLLGLLAVQAGAQDRIYLTDGTVIDNARVMSWTVSELKYSSRGRSDAVSSDRVDRVELEKFQDVYKRGIAGRDPTQFITTAREQARNNDKLLAALGYLAAARIFLDAGEDGQAFSTLDELQNTAGDTGAIADVYRLKLEVYLSKGDARNSGIVANRYATEATTNGWPNGFLQEAEFFKILAEDAGGQMDPKSFQNRLRGMLPSVTGAFPSIANRINVQLARSLRQAGDVEAAQKIYEELLKKDGVDVNSLAGAYLGMGHINYAKGDPNNKEPYRAALLDFLHVYIDTKDAWDSLVAEALYHAALSAEKWGGPDWKYIHGKLRFLLMQEYPGSEWADRMKSR